MEAKVLEHLCKRGSFYEFDYSDPEDAACVLALMGGEENLKQNYPLVYEAYLASVQEARLKKSRNGEEEKKTDVKISSMTREECGGGVKVKVATEGLFADPDYAADNALRGESPRPWRAGNMSAVIYNEEDPVECYCSKSFSFEQADNFQHGYETEELPQEIAKKCATTMIVNVLDPNNRLRTFSDHRSSLSGTEMLVDTLVIDDPDTEFGNNPIIMLYGRKRQDNTGYLNADYYDDDAGEYYDNSPKNGTVKTIMPLKGKVQFKSGCSFPADGVLHKPRSADPPPFDQLIRSNLKIGGIKVATMYNDQSEDVAYETMKKCFRTDTSGAFPTVYFDFKRDGKHDWHSDTEKVGRFTNKALTYMLSGGFVLDVIDSKGNPVNVNISITSSAKENMGGKQYQVSNSNQAFVPPVIVHWGCFAKGTPVRLASGQDRTVDMLQAGDQVVTSDGRIVTFGESVTGHEKTIFTIVAENGTIRLTGGHPVLLADGTAKAAGLLGVGDKLRSPQGENAVLAVEESVYDDMVYNPIFRESGEEGLFILCGGFYCGDYNAQNRPIRCESNLSEYDKELIDQFNKLMQVQILG